MFHDYGVQSITPRCNDSQSNLWLVKNVVGLQKSDQELRVSYKPTAFRRWVVDMREKVFTNGNSLIGEPQAIFI